MMERLESIPGIGPQNALALTACYHRGEFRSVDAFSAFLGLFVRVWDSGLLRGRRLLTKQGDPVIRRLLYNAAMSFSRNPEYQAYRESLLARGLSSTAAYVVIARKLARVAFTLLRKNREFDPNIFTIPCK
jgi:transposase